jgi:hypothetical protein
MAWSAPKVEYENDCVRVLRVRREGRGPMPEVSRNDRLVVYLEDGNVARTEEGRKEMIHRKAGDVIWRPRSEHKVEVLEDGPHEVLIVELKR